ncbi:MerR family transcriptional regulator [Lacinutrix sp.]|uniref:MerR family transcriptional regulator n=1 Tax=Lacinutrix sp. TaxID=1937692 RepID=UPI0030EBD44E
MINDVKTKFSIKDLENLSGIKAHTIRIWEKRYSLFQPNRSDTNIRNYSLTSLQKILNISFLNNNGYKISKIANLEEEEIPILVREISENINKRTKAINDFKMSMFSFDQTLFDSTFNNLMIDYSFQEIFYSSIIPFLNDIGLLWQTGTITPAHEHFIVELIKQKILVSTERAFSNNIVKNDSRTYVLYLPDNEIHELGLLFMNYELTNKGFYSIYLGQSIPIDSLEYLTDFYNDITFVSCFTVKPEAENISDYLEELTRKVLKGTNNKLYLSGRRTQDIDTKNLNEKILIKGSIQGLLDNIELKT